MGSRQIVGFSPDGISVVRRAPHAGPRYGGAEWIGSGFQADSRSNKMRAIPERYIHRRYVEWPKKMFW
jgi:hypothetical protein